MAVKLKSVYKLFHMSGDIVYALLFPQLTAAMYMPEYVNWFGSTCAFIVGLLLRFLSGEPFLGIEAYIHWPGFLPGKFSLENSTLKRKTSRRITHRWTQADVHVPNCINDNCFRCSHGHFAAIRICSAKTRNRNFVKKSRASCPQGAHHRLTRD